MLEEYNLESPLYDSSAFIPANYNHLNIELSADNLSENPPEHFIVPFYDHSVTISQLLKELLKLTGLGQKYPLSRLQVSLKVGFQIKAEWTLEQLRILLCRESASGVTLRAEAVFISMHDQAAKSLYIHNQSDFHRGKISKWFLLLNNQEPFSLTLKKDIPFKELQIALCSSLNEFYANKVEPTHLRFFVIEKAQEDVVFAWRKVRELEGKEVSAVILKAEHEMVGVEAVKEGSKWPVSEVESEEYLIFHIDKTRKVKLKFALIAKYRVGELLNHLQIEHSNSLGIKIVDEIFQPCRLVKEAEKYFKTGEGLFAKNVECRLVSEREMFYSSMDSMGKDFPISEAMVTQAKGSMFKQCRDLAQRRIDQLAQSNINIFASAEEISPITLYTSSVDIIDKGAKSSEILYRTLNGFLRNSRFGLASNYHEEWRYNFSAALIRALLKLQPFDQLNPETNCVTVFRGIRGHQLQGEVGDLYVAKEFVSTSVDRKKAKKFASNAPIGTLLEIECISGRSISQFSIYQTEMEVLFMPYTYFRILEKEVSEGLVFMRLKELPQYQYRSNPATEILWVDDKLKEGEKVIGSLNCPMHTTFLHQLTSTKALKEWIHAHQHIVRNPAVEIAVITNMRRWEDDVEVVDAGAHTVRLVRELLPRSKVVFYIGHIEGTIARLRDHKIDPSSVNIINKQAQLREFIAVSCAPPEENQTEEEQVIFETTQSVLSAFSPTGSKAHSGKSEEALA